MLSDRSFIYAFGIPAAAPWLTRLLFSAGLLGLGQPAAWAQTTACEIKSTEYRRTTLELYTSEGCNSCPPADQWLRRFRHSPLAQQVIPLAFHVDYWNQLGWADRFSRPQFTQRQQKAADRNRASFVYTPQFLLDGKDIRPMYSADVLKSRLDPITQSAAQARISAKIALEAGAGIRVSGEVHSDRRDTEVYVALYEHNLRSQVTRGENTGRALEHDYVVRAWAGPLRANGDHPTRLDTLLAVPADARLPHVGVAIWAQDSRSGTLLQAASKESCF